MTRLKTAALATLGLAAFITFAALGTWQLERRVWKLDLIQRVNDRVAAPAAAAPRRPQWPGVNRDSHEYQHVTVTGHYLPGRDTLVHTATELGTGYWLLSPLQREDGSTVLINRGFVEQGTTLADVSEDEIQPVNVSGLLRMSEPDGGVLRDNDPKASRWYSRDVAAIAAAQDLRDVAPYFIDADNSSSGPPVGGLTVIRFHNSHLIYAITWFGLALMVIGAAGLVLREVRRP